MFAAACACASLLALSVHLQRVVTISVPIPTISKRVLWTQAPCDWFGDYLDESNKYDVIAVCRSRSTWGSCHEACRQLGIQYFSEDQCVLHDARESWMCQENDEQCYKCNSYDPCAALNCGNGVCSSNDGEAACSPAPDGESTHTPTPTETSMPTSTPASSPPATTPTSTSMPTPTATRTSTPGPTPTSTPIPALNSSDPFLARGSCSPTHKCLLEYIGAYPLGIAPSDIDAEAWNSFPESDRVEYIWAVSFAQDIRGDGVFCMSQGTASAGCPSDAKFQSTLDTNFKDLIAFVTAHQQRQSIFISLGGGGSADKSATSRAAWKDPADLDSWIDSAKNSLTAICTAFNCVGFDLQFEHGENAELSASTTFAQALCPVMEYLYDGGNKAISIGPFQATLGAYANLFETCGGVIAFVNYQPYAASSSAAEQLPSVKAAFGDTPVLMGLETNGRGPQPGTGEYDKILEEYMKGKDEPKSGVFFWTAELNRKRGKGWDLEAAIRDLPPATGKGVPGALCKSDSDCENDECGRPTAADDAIPECCTHGTAELYAGYDYCTQMPDESVCWSDAQCASGHCDDNSGGFKKGKCVPTQRPPGSSCEFDSDCENGECGRPTAADDAVPECCTHGTAELYAGYDYCTQMPSDSVCWSDAQCASGYCGGNAGGLVKGACS